MIRSQSLDPRVQIYYLTTLMMIQQVQHPFQSGWRLNPPDANWNFLLFPRVQKDAISAKWIPGNFISRSRLGFSSFVILQSTWTSMSRLQGKINSKQELIDIFSEIKFTFISFTRSYEYSTEFLATLKPDRNISFFWYAIKTKYPVPLDPWVARE